MRPSELVGLLRGGVLCSRRLTRATTRALRCIQRLGRHLCPVVVELVLGVRQHAEVGERHHLPVVLGHGLLVLIGHQKRQRNCVVLGVAQHADHLHIRVVLNHPVGYEALAGVGGGKRRAVVAACLLLARTECAQNELVALARRRKGQGTLAVLDAETEDSRVLTERKLNGIHLERRAGKKGLASGMFVLYYLSLAATLCLRRLELSIFSEPWSVKAPFLCQKEPTISNNRIGIV